MELERDMLVSPTGEVPVIEGELVTAIRTLADRGVGKKTIAREVGVAVNTVRRYLRQPIEAGVPNRALLDQPTFGVGHGSWFQPTGPHPPALLGLHEAASFKHPDVLHQAGQRHGKWSGELPDRRLPLAQSRQDRSPGRVRKSAEHMVKMRW